MKLERIILPFVTMLWFNAAGGQLICQTGLAETTSIRQIKFSDFTFVRQNSAEIIPLQKGEYAGPDNHSYALMNVTYGDIAGDGIEQAVVLLRGHNTRTSPTLDEVFIYTLKDGKPFLLTNFEGGKRGEYIVSVDRSTNFRVNHQLLILDRAVRIDECEYVPTHYYTLKFRWSGTQMLEIERSLLKPLPENMREIG